MVEVTAGEGKVEGQAGGGGGIAAAPVGAPQQVADLGLAQLGQELQASPTEQIRLALQVNRPVGITMLFPVGLLASDEALDFFQGRWSGVGELAQDVLALVEAVQGDGLGRLERRQGEQASSEAGDGGGHGDGQPPAGANRQGAVKSMRTERSGRPGGRVSAGTSRSPGPHRETAGLLRARLPAQGWSGQCCR